MKGRVFYVDTFINFEHFSLSKSIWTKFVGLKLFDSKGYAGVLTFLKTSSDAERTIKEKKGYFMVDVAEILLAK